MADNIHEKQESITWKEYGNIELSYNYTIDTLKNYAEANSLKMIDIGTNMGSLPFLMWSRKGYNMVGVKCNSEAVKSVKNKYTEIVDKLFVVRTKLEKFESESYDVITMFDVIEHISDVEVYLKENVFRILRGGILYSKLQTGGLTLYSK